jgi:hypothetical protein
MADQKQTNGITDMSQIPTTFAACAFSAPLTAAERDRAIRHLEYTRPLFLESIRGLTPEQWSFKPAPGVWSVAEVAEHITLAEGRFLDLVTKKILALPSDPSQVEQARGKDVAVLGWIPDGKHKFQAPEFVRPRGRWSQAQIPQEFNDRRDRTIEYVRTSQDDLRHHTFAVADLGALDAYQWILLISAHCRSHTSEVHELKTQPNFPTTGF